MEKIIVDAGPLVALLDEAEEHHAWSKEALASLSPPFLTCDAVLSEACFCLASVNRAYSLLSALIKQGVIIPVSLDGLHGKIFDLMDRYHRVPMSFADACLVCMVENNPGAIVFTLDHHFDIYRQHRRRVIPLIAPFSP